MASSSISEPFSWLPESKEIDDASGKARNDYQYLRKKEPVHRRRKHTITQPARLPYGTGTIQIAGQPNPKQQKLLFEFENTLHTLVLAYQPIVDAKTHRTIGWEALMRPQTKSLSNPLILLERGEELGTLHDIGRTVRQIAAAEEQSRPKDSLLFINLHPQDLLDPYLFTSSTPLAHVSNKVVLEVTEQCSLTNIPHLERRLQKLSEMGYRIAIDDLGAGYSHLQQFGRHVPDFVKLDLSLVRDIDTNRANKRKVAAIIASCREREIAVIGEGVESQEEAQTLLCLGCPFLQGYFFGRPEIPVKATVSPSAAANNNSTSSNTEDYPSEDIQI